MQTILEKAEEFSGRDFVLNNAGVVLMVKNKILLMAMVVLFGIPGIFAEGLHIVLPGGIGMIYHTGDQSGNNPQNRTPLPQPFQFNPNCPICQFCSISVVSSFAFVLTALIVLVGLIETRTYYRPEYSFCRIVFKRGPPQSVQF